MNSDADYTSHDEFVEIGSNPVYSGFDADSYSAIQFSAQECETMESNVHIALSADVPMSAGSNVHIAVTSVF